MDLQLVQSENCFRQSIQDQSPTFNFVRVILRNFCEFHSFHLTDDLECVEKVNCYQRGNKICNYYSKHSMDLQFCIRTAKYRVYINYYDYEMVYHKGVSNEECLILFSHSSSI